MMPEMSLSSLASRILDLISEVLLAQKSITLTPISSP